MARTRLAVTLLMFVLLVGCGPDAVEDTKTDSAEAPVVYTTFYPTTYFAQRIGGDLVQVVCPVPHDEDAIFWKPDDEQIRAYQEADLIVINGAEFEKWVLTTTLPDARVVDTARSFADEFVTFEQAVEHSHGPSGAHAHEGIDGHTWLDPLHAKTQAREIAKALARLLPDDAEAMERRLGALEKDLDEIDLRLKEMTDGYTGAPILASHPAYNYLAKRYRWKIVNLDLDPEEMPDDATWTSIKATLEQSPARHILWESRPLESIAKRFQDELGVRSVVFSPCELMSAEDLASGLDYVGVMRTNLDGLKNVLQPE